ncbi:hypothetical protein SAMN06264364_105101 [Quadrisphaera granulorum]|uniref:DUF4386 family protein n=1 Tax=Quadrisphaera granulorum TaxID=317664 RepID=A0A316ADD7_9ACTN|nr:hypothetical protein [Quadrisphaera granulorum]PWJ54894.1 hypothetical protein BXY45_105101 [Quadrisphaera granulorum]SZE95840.1 hypothetical protein SAMN06264364_105101 [Quadrisphaera granulorum]
MTTDSAQTGTTPPALAPRARSPIPGGLLVAVAGAVLLTVTNALVNFGAYSRATTTADVITSMGEHQGLYEVTIAVGLVSVVLLVPGIWAVGAVLAVRTPVLAGIGAWLGATGYLLSTVLSLESAAALGVARAVLEDGADPAAYVAGVDQYAPVAMIGVYTLFGLGGLFGFVVLGVAVLRQAGSRGPLPRWAGWALILSAPVRMGGLIFGVAAGPPLASLLITAALLAILLAARRPAVSR